MQSPTITTIDFSADYQQCFLTLQDGRTAELATTELTPEGQSVDGEGVYYVVDVDTAYRDEDGFVSYDRTEACGICEWVETEMHRETLETLALVALARGTEGVTWEVTGHEFDWQRNPITRKITAASWSDLVHLTRHWHKVYGVQRCGAVGSEFGQVFAGLAA